MVSVAEEWRPMLGRESEYEVSSQGRVRSLSRLVVRRRGRSFMRLGRMLKVHVAKVGYPAVRLSDRIAYVHSLVLEAFVGPRPPKHEACHCNGIRTDNRVENLRWDSASENQRDRVTHGTSNRGERCASAKLTAEQAKEIMDSTEPGCDLARRYGVAQQTICNIRKGRAWTHLREPVT